MTTPGAEAWVHYGEGRQWDPITGVWSTVTQDATEGPVWVHYGDAMQWNPHLGTWTAPGSPNVPSLPPKPAAPPPLSNLGFVDPIPPQGVTSWLVVDDPLRPSSGIVFYGDNFIDTTGQHACLHQVFFTPGGEDIGSWSGPQIVIQTDDSYVASGAITKGKATFDTIGHMDYTGWVDLVVVFIDVNATASNFGTQWAAPFYYDSTLV